MNQKDLGLRQVHNIHKILSELLTQGAKFHEPDIVRIKLEQGILSKNDSVDNNCSVRARGLPWQSIRSRHCQFLCGFEYRERRRGVMPEFPRETQRRALVLFEKRSPSRNGVKKT